MIAGQLAAVRPRFDHPDTGDALLVEDEVRNRLALGQSGLVELVGLPGSGKTTALAHLAQVFAGEPGLILADRPSEQELIALLAASWKKLVVCASAGRLPRGRAEFWNLSSWTNDERLEYLWRRHPERCAAVMRRLVSVEEGGLLRGLPELWTAVLDRLAADVQLESPAAALRQAACRQAGSPQAQIEIQQWCFDAILHPDEAELWFQPLRRLLGRPDAAGPLRHVETQLLLAADHLAEHLRVATRPWLLDERLPPALVRETAQLIQDDAPAIARLRELLLGIRNAPQAMAASLLHAAGDVCPPRRNSDSYLAGAYLSRVRWPRLKLKTADWNEAQLRHADLRRARIGRLIAFRADLTGANLAGSKLRQLLAADAKLTRANLSDLCVRNADFRAADLRSARLERAELKQADFSGADLSEARCARADLTRAMLADATVAGADFTGANLNAANLCGLDLRSAELTAARFYRAWLQGCNLESLRIPAADFESAQLEGAFLTGSQMPGGCFYGANLQRTGLADIDWERADLRDANLRDCTFHLGSSRSGLVGSPIACEGSRTGFYTDDYCEQDFKAPEEIRKANLRGADLRGAGVDGVDFYLVDLRDARYTPGQAEHFRRCGAILEARVR